MGLMNEWKEILFVLVPLCGRAAQVNGNSRKPSDELLMEVILNEMSRFLYQSKSGLYLSRRKVCEIVRRVVERGTLSCRTTHARKRF